MDIINKVYIVSYKNEIISYFNPYSLEDAIEIGISHFVDIFRETYGKEPDDNNDFQDFIESKIKEQNFTVSIISGNRLRFKTSKELISYFMSNINSIDTNNLYDFLLSFVDSHDITYNYRGERIYDYISTQCPSEEYGWDPHIEFTQESCKEGKYRFSYDEIGIDTLYHAPWIKEK